MEKVKRVLDLFAGPGGWAMGLRRLGIAEFGVELDDDACATRKAAGHSTIQADVAALNPVEFSSETWGLVASPPCPDFSAAGKKVGDAGASGRLIYEVLRWARAIQPSWIVCEQVPEALPIYKSFAKELREEGSYYTWAGKLLCADYGVPQTRTRAFLLASREFPPEPPKPTHARQPGQMGLLEDEPLLPWVSMADALGWGITDAPSPTVTGGGVGAGGGPEPIAHVRRQTGAAVARGAWKVGFPRLDDLGDSEDGYRERDWRPDTEPAFALTQKARSWVRVPVLNTGQDFREAGNRDSGQKRSSDQPAPTLSGKSGTQWWWELPATTVAGDSRITARNHHDEGSQGRSPKSTEQVRAGDYEGSEPIKLTVAEASLLQTFPGTYPWVGTKSSKFRQIGNAVPPLMAYRVLEQFCK